MPSVSIAPPTKAQTTTAITLKANCSVIFNPFLIKFTLLTPLGYNQITKRNPKGAKTMDQIKEKYDELTSADLSKIAAELTAVAVSNGALNDIDKGDVASKVSQIYKRIFFEITKIELVDAQL